MQLIFMRHAQAGPYIPDDATRTLTELGHRQAKESSDKLISLYRPQLLITSPYDRARQTAEHLLSAHQNKQLSTITPINTIISHAITPDSDPNFALNELFDLHAKHSSPACVVVVCHMPIVARMSAILTNSYYTDDFHLAEFRAFQCDYIAPMLGREIQRYHPTLD